LWWVERKYVEGAIFRLWEGVAVIASPPHKSHPNYEKSNDFWGFKIHKFLETFKNNPSNITPYYRIGRDRVVITYFFCFTLTATLFTQRKAVLEIKT